MAYYLGLAARRHFSTTISRLGKGGGAGAGAGSGAGSGSGSGAGAGGGSMAMWKGITLFVAAPVLVLAHVNAIIGETEHLSHPRPEFRPYAHLRIRNSSFPWGDGNHTLFHNRRLNPLPEGYEDEDENDD